MNMIGFNAFTLTVNSLRMVDENSNKFSFCGQLQCTVTSEVPVLWSCNLFQGDH